MTPFLPLCRTGSLCAVCLKPKDSDIHRAAWSLKFSGVPAAGEPCPHGKEWQAATLTVEGGSLPPPSNEPAGLRPRASLSAANLASFLGTILARPRVDAQTVAERRVACLKCSYLGQDDKGTYCGVPTGCGCGVVQAPTYFGLTIEGADLTLYEEVDGDLCQHPARKGTLGMGWPVGGGGAVAVA